MNKEFVIFLGLLVVAYFLYNRSQNEKGIQASASLGSDPYWKILPTTRS